jgi:hypothetical protein
VTAADRQRYQDAAREAAAGVRRAVAANQYDAQTSAQESDEIAPLRIALRLGQLRVDARALVKLLIQKGSITLDEWDAARADSMEQERDSYA